MIQPSNQAKLYRDLALTILKCDDATQRSYAIWLILRSTGQYVFDQNEVIDYLASKTDRTKPTVKKWLAHAIKLGFFRRGRGGQLWLVGRTKIFEKFLPDTLPGPVILVDMNRLLTPKNAQLRSVLYGCLFAKKTMWASRNTLTDITGKHKLTQLKYDRLNQQPKRFSFALVLDPRKAHLKDKKKRFIAEQKPNLYQRAACYATPTPTSRKSKFNFYCDRVQKTPERQSESFGPVGFVELVTPGSRDFDLAEKRVLFNDPETAEQTAKRRCKAGLGDVTFSIIPDKKIVYRSRDARKHGHVFLQAHVGGMV